MNVQTYVQSHLERALRGEHEAAFFGLLESPFDVIPELIKRYRESDDEVIRSLLVQIVWQYREPSTISFLTEALNDSHADVWKEALNGLVAFGNQDALGALVSASSRTFQKEKDRVYFLEWLNEAILQIENSIPDITKGA